MPDISRATREEKDCAASIALMAAFALLEDPEAGSHVWEAFIILAKALRVEKYDHDYVKALVDEAIQESLEINL